MFTRALKQLNQMHTAVLAPEHFCASYWAGFVGFNGNEQDPIKTASFYKESGHN